MPVVIDTNVLISYALRPHSTPAYAARKAISDGTLIFTHATLAEFVNVLSRSKFSRYATLEMRTEFVRYILRAGEIAPVTRPITSCRDPDDNKFLDAAVHGRASHLITGDEDLLVLHPFMKVQIITPTAFLAL